MTLEDRKNGDDRCAQADQTDGYPHSKAKVALILKYSEVESEDGEFGDRQDDNINVFGNIDWSLLDLIEELRKEKYNL